MSRKRWPKRIHYVQLQTYRQWPNESTYLAHLGSLHSKIRPIIYQIDRILNEKWIEIRRPELIDQLNEDHQQNVRKHFLHQTNLFDYKYFHFNSQLNEKNEFLREIFIHSIEITDSLLYLYRQIEDGERHIYEYRLDRLKSEFRDEENALNHLFRDQELKELENQIEVLNVIEQDEIFQEFIQFKFKKRQLEEEFFKDSTLLHGHFQTEIIALRSIRNQIIHSNDREVNLASRHCRHLLERTRQSQVRIDQEIVSIDIFKRKIQETRNSIADIDMKDKHLRYSNHLNLEKSFSTISQVKRNAMIFRRFSVLMNNIEKDCQKKLSKAERLLLLVNQCERLELEDEKLLRSTSKRDFNQTTDQIHYLRHCHFEFDSYFDQLTFFWKRFAHTKPRRKTYK